LANVSEGICRSLDDFPGDAQAIVFTIDAGTGVALDVDGSRVRMNAFVQEIVGNILRAMVDSLEGIPAVPRSIELTL
jgi:hypothetical protein